MGRINVIIWERNMILVLRSRLRSVLILLLWRELWTGFGTDSRTGIKTELRTVDRVEVRIYDQRIMVSTKVTGLRTTVFKGRFIVTVLRTELRTESRLVLWSVLWLV